MAKVITPTLHLFIYKDTILIILINIMIIILILILKL